jgi:hypothetical protein
MTTYAAATTIAGDTIVWLAVGLATTALVAAGTFVLAVAFFAVFDGGEEDVQDVQRFIALTEEARSLVPPGPPLLDPEGGAAAAEAIDRFKAKKDEARAALWASRDRRRAAERRPEPAPGQPSRGAAPLRGHEGESEAGAAAFGVLDVDTASVTLGDLPDDRQSEPGSRLSPRGL